MYSVEEVVNPRISEDSGNRTIDYVYIEFPLSAYRCQGQKLEVRARLCGSGSIDLDSLKSELCVNANRDRQFRSVNMEFEKAEGEDCIFKGEFHISDDIGGSFFYTVRFSDDNCKTWRYAEDKGGEKAYRNLIIGPKWLRKANVYEIYPRVHKCSDKDSDGKTGERDFSTLVDIKDDLHRIKSLNVDAIWLMPIYPIGEVNRKEEFGCPYSTKDYFGIDPNLVEGGLGKSESEVKELGRRQLRDLIDTAHQAGMKVILGFVGGHCAPDNPLAYKWSFKDENGKPMPPDPDWSDTAELRYGAGVDEEDKPKYPADEDREAMWSFMISILKYWVEEFDVDGYRCDFAHWVPLAFWRRAINEVKQIKPSVAFIGEVYERLREHLEVGFDTVYHFELYNQLKSLHHEIRDGDPYFEIPHISAKIEYENSIYPDGYRLFRYTENHDEIRAAEMFGDPESLGAQAAKAPTLLSFTLPGIPCIYAGQESGETIRPPLFKGDRGVADFPQIDFDRDAELTDWYRRIMRIRKENNALTEGDLEFMSSDNKRILAYSRVAGDSKVVVAINFDYTDGNRQWANLNIAGNLGIDDSADRRYRLHDILNDEVFVYSGEQLSKQLVVGLDQFKSSIFVVKEETQH